jgi:tetratricopeptide (TPR) repeat protein
MSRIPVLIALFVTLLLQSVTAFAAKTLASEAIATAIEKGTFRQIRQELMMDLHQKQKYEFDEAGVDALGLRLLGQGQRDTGIEVLQLNQALHNESPGAAIAVADACRKSGQSKVARLYYEKALDLDPGNQDARRGLQQNTSDEVDPMMGVMGDWELDPEAMQESMAQMGIEMSPEQMEQMQEAMAQLQQMQASGGQVPTRTASRTSSSTSKANQPSTPAEPAHESEFCEVLYRFNSDKTIPDAAVRARFEGEYGEASDADRRRTWNVETSCGEFLLAVPLWADVSPPILIQKGENRFEDSMGGSWDFETGDDGKVEGVTQTSQDGSVSKMIRLGNPRSFD